MRAGPRRADERKHLGLPGGAHVLVPAAGVFARVEVGDLAARTRGVAEMVRAGLHLRFAGVEPERADAELVVVRLELLPEESTGPFVGGVVEGDADLGRGTAVRPVALRGRAALAHR